MKESDFRSLHRFLGFAICFRFISENVSRSTVDQFVLLPRLQSSDWGIRWFQIRSRYGPSPRRTRQADTADCGTDARKIERLRE